MKILFVYPKMTNTATRLHHIASLYGFKTDTPPLALLTISSMLPKEWEKKLVDLNTDNVSDDQILWADFVMISAMNVQIKSVNQIIERCKTLGIKTIAGGPLFTHEYDKFPDVTHLILNEAEITLPQFLSDLESGSPNRIYKTDKFADIQTTPIPDWSLVDLSKYLYSILQYSRGCPYLCDFCDVTTLYGRTPRVKTSQQVIDELNSIMKRFPAKMIFFADDNFIGNRKFLKTSLLPALIEWRKKIPNAPQFSTQLTITLADDEELMRLMLEAGFRHILIGVETVNQESLISMNKKQNLKRDLLENVLLLQKKGFIIIGTFIVGTDFDSPEIFDEISNFIQSGGIVYTIINVLKAPYGTELYERMKRENRLISEFNFGEDQTNFVPVMGTEKLRSGYNNLIDHVFSSKAVFERAKIYFLNLEPYKVVSNIDQKFKLMESVRIMRGLFLLFIIFKGRKDVWKMFIWTLYHKPKYLGLAFVFSALMYHYSKLKTSYENR